MNGELKMEKVANKVKAKIANALDCKVDVCYSDSEIIFDLYLVENEHGEKSKYDYFKFYVEYEEDKKVLDYLKNIIEMISEEEYDYYEADDFERAFKEFVSNFEIDNSNIYEGDIYIKGYKAIKIKNIKNYDFDIADITLTLKYQNGH